MHPGLSYPAWSADGGIVAGHYLRRRDPVMGIPSTGCNERAGWMRYAGWLGIGAPCTTVPNPWFVTLSRRHLYGFVDWFATAILGRAFVTAPRSNEPILAMTMPSDLTTDPRVRPSFLARLE